MCPCGYYGDSLKPCSCAHALVTKYQKRIFGPLLDRIDIHAEVPRVDYEKLSGDRLSESSDSIRSRVQAARDIQNKRFSIIGDNHHMQSVSLPTRLPTWRGMHLIRLWKFKHQHRPATGHGAGSEASQTVWGGARVEQAIAHKGEELIKL